MSTNVTKYGDISPRTGAYAEAKLLERGQHMMVTERFGQIDPQGKNQTKTRKYRRYLPLARATAPLAEGVTPAGQKLNYEDVSVTLDQLGDVVTLTDVILDTHEDMVLQETMKLVGEQVAETVEEYRINVLKSGTNVFFANSVANRAAVVSQATKADFRRIYRSLKKNKAKFISQIIKASPLYATEPVAPAYFVMGHTDCDADIRDIAGFVEVEKYSNSDKSLPGEIGKLDNFRFILTGMFEPWLAAGTSSSTMLTNGTTGTGAADVYPLIVVAQDAYSIVPLMGKGAVVPMVKNPSPVIGDELAQRGFVSWKTWQGTVILQQTWMARLEVAARQNPT